MSNTIVIQGYLAGSVVIQDYEAGTIIATQSGVTLPSWLSLAYEAIEAGVADGDPVATQTCPISGVIRTSAGTARPIYRADYLATGVAGYEADGVDDISVTTTTVNLTAGYTYCALVYFPSPLANFRTLYETGVSGVQQGALYGNGGATLTLAERDGVVTQVAVGSGVLTGQWQIITAVHNGASSELFRDRASIGTGTVTLPTSAQVIRFLKGTGVIAPNGMRGAVAADYFGPVSNGTQRTELWDYINAKHGVSL